jgi:putative transposase
MLLQTSGVGLIIKEPVLKPFWTPACQALSDKLWLPIKTDSADSDSTWSNTSSTHLVENSWFSTTLQVPLKKKWSKISLASSTSLVVDYTDFVSTKPKLKKTAKSQSTKICLRCDNQVEYSSNKFLCSEHYTLGVDSVFCQGRNANKTNCKYKATNNGFCGHHSLQIKTESVNYEHSRLIRIKTTPAQLAVYKQMFGVARKMYNDGVTAVRKKLANLSNVRDFVTKQSDTLDYCKRIPLKIRQGALEDYIKAQSNCYKKWKKTHKKQKCKYKSKKASSQSIYMNHDAIKRVTDRSFLFYPTAITKLFTVRDDAILRTDEDLPEIIPTHCRMVMRHSKYLYIAIPLEIPRNNVKPTYNTMVALDCGERTFQTFYSPQMSGSIGNHTRHRYEKLFTEADKIKSKLAKVKKRFKKTNGINRKRLRKVLKSLQRKFLSVITKPTRITKELHDKTALFLCKNFKVIAIPEYSCKEVAGKLPSVINKSNQALSHYKFRQRLIHKAKQLERIVHFVPESYTSVTCTKCGNINVSCKDEMLECYKCKLTTNRDLRGSRNIYLKTIDVFRKLKEQ